MTRGKRGLVTTEKTKEKIVIPKVREDSVEGRTEIQKEELEVEINSLECEMRQYQREADRLAIIADEINKKLKQLKLVLATFDNNKLIKRKRKVVEEESEEQE